MEMIMMLTIQKDYLILKFSNFWKLSDWIKSLRAKILISLETKRIGKLIVPIMIWMTLTSSSCSKCFQTMTLNNLMWESSLLWLWNKISLLRIASTIITQELPLWNRSKIWKTWNSILILLNQIRLNKMYCKVRSLILESMRVKQADLLQASQTCTFKIENSGCIKIWITSSTTRTYSWMQEIKRLIESIST